MIIDNTEYLMDSIDIINLLKVDLAQHNIDYLKDVKDGPKNIQITCPYHANGQERKPSAGIRKSDGITHCFACGATHTLPEVISYCFGYDGGSYGKRWLDTHIQDRIHTNGRARYKESQKEVVTNNFVSEEELDEYRWTHPYWAKRGIVNEKIIELFDLGYDRKTQCITFPVRDMQGNCEFVAKRSVNTKFFKYPQGVSKPLYGLYELCSLGLQDEEIIVCESMIDCILLWQSDHYAVALNGLGNERQFKQLRDLPCKNLILATDNDKAGRDARERIRKKVTNKWISEIVFPKGIKDIGECSKEQINNILDWREFIVFRG
jgi:DNA primase